MIESAQTDSRDYLQSAEALAVWFNPTRCAIAWREGPNFVRPREVGKTIAELQPGDTVFHHGEEREVHSISVYR